MTHCTRAQLGQLGSSGYLGFVRGESLGPAVSESRGRALRGGRFLLPTPAQKRTVRVSLGPTTNGSDRVLRRVVSAPSGRERRSTDAF